MERRTRQYSIQEHPTKRKNWFVYYVRFETPPGKQLQGDFGHATIEIGEEKRRIHLCVLTLGYSRRPYVEVRDNERTAR